MKGTVVNTRSNLIDITHLNVTFLLAKEICLQARALRFLQYDGGSPAGGGDACGCRACDSEGQSEEEQTKSSNIGQQNQAENGEVRAIETARDDCWQSNVSESGRQGGRFGRRLLSGPAI